MTTDASGSWVLRRAEQGFGVGHTRETQTRGIWVWGHPQPVTAPGGGNATVSSLSFTRLLPPAVPSPPPPACPPQADAASGWAAPLCRVQLLVIDTEGFEATHHSNSYDDRIFAVSAVLSSLLIYNLPETIRESDVSKLSFAVDLAQGFYDSSQVSTLPANWRQQLNRCGASAWRHQTHDGRAGSSGCDHVAPPRSRLMRGLVAGTARRAFAAIQHDICHPARLLARCARPCTTAAGAALLAAACLQAGGAHRAVSLPTRPQQHCGSQCGHVTGRRQGRPGAGQ